jgi:Cdc6-like AAA superfamily ATPase
MGKLILEKKALDYERYGLKNNPFPYAGIPKEEPPFCADREKELETIADVINFSFGRNSTHIALIGSYGNGKTHILRYIKSQVKSQLNSNPDSRALAGYVITPGNSFVDMYRNLMHDLGQSFFVGLVWEFIGRITLGELERDDFEHDGDSDILIEKLERQPILIKRIIDDGAILLPQVLKVARNIVLRLVKNSDVATAFLQLINESTSILAWKWLSGEQILYEQRRRMGVVSTIESDDIALMVFQDVRSIMRYLSYELVCLLIDEFELVEMLHYKQKQRYLNTLRHLIDLNPEGLCLILSCTPEVWKNVVMEYHAFSERIFREIVLSPMNQDTIHVLIRHYLASGRIDESSNTDLYYPFKEESISEVLKNSQGNMRRALALCNMAIDQGIKKNIDHIPPVLIAEIYEGIL